MPYKEVEINVLDLVRKQRCFICHRAGPSDPHHIKTRGAGGQNELRNIIPLCRICHTKIHQIGIKSAVEKYNLPISWESGWPQRTDLD